MNPLSALGKYFLKIYQTFPQLIPFFGIYYGLLTVNYWLMAFGLSAVFSNGTNKLVKILVELLYKGTGKKTLPVLGLGGRPKDARDCSAFTHCDTCHIRPTSFGMPSGHSQMGWFFFAYGTFFLADHVMKSFKTSDNPRRDAKIWFSVGFVFLLTMAVTLSYSRVHLSCHTPQQVIFGAFLGLGFGVLSYYLSKVVIEKSTDINIFDELDIIFN